MLVACCVSVGCGGDDSSTGGSLPAVAAGQGPGAAGQNVGVVGGAGTIATAPTGPMPGLGTIMMTPPAIAGGPALAGTGGSGAAASGGAAGYAGAGAGSGGQAGGAVPGGAGSQAAGAGAAGSMSGNAGAPGGGGPPGEMDPTTVCMGGKPGMDSDAVTTRGQTSSRNFAVVQYLVRAPNKISRFQTILAAPKVPAQRSTLFIWPGLQHNGGSDPGRVGNGVLQPVLTWGPSCNPKAPREGSNYMGWWISAMYVNISTGAAGPGGCAGGDAMDVAVADRLYIDFAVKGTEWTQTVVNLTNMKKVDFTTDLKGQDQNWVIWDIETPGSSRPAEDTIFEKSVLTFTSPVTSCQPTSAAEVDYFSAPILSADGLNCCFEKMILKAKRN
jgi:hypothetical protein